VNPRSPADNFIVDNSDEHWKALEYLRQWCEISDSIDIATGHFEIGALLALDGEWQKVRKVRLLIGGETSRQTADAIAAALDRSIAIERTEHDPFLTGVEAVVQAVRDGKIEIRTYRRRKFHAKAYITHGRLDVVGSAALVGSSNFTRPGLTQNVELNVRFSGPEVVELQRWFEEHWVEAEPVQEELLRVLERSTREFTPYEVYAKALQALTRDMEPSEIAWETSSSLVYPLLAPYQKEAYHGLRQMAQRWNGGFLTDGVGLGKTFVGLMLTEYYAVRMRKNVLIMATKTGEDAVWRPELERRLPHLFGEFTNVKVMAHTDLSKADAPQMVEQLRQRVDVVIMDEAHNFRNHGKQGDDEETPRSRWWRMQRLCEGKTVFLLTATPVNNSLFDLVHQLEFFTGMSDSYFASVGVSSLQHYVAQLEKPFRDQAKAGGATATIDLTDFDRLMREDRLLESVVWQNSRKYAVESARMAGGGDVVFPEQRPPQVVAYNLGLHFGALLNELEAAFAKKEPLFVLPMYYPLAFSRAKDIDTIAENRQKQIVGLIRTTFLKRFESSVAAFAGSCLDLAAKILLWLDVNTQHDELHARRLEGWHNRNNDLLKDVHDKFRSTQAMPDTEIGDDITAEELEELEIHLPADQYDLDAMIAAAFEDLTQLGRFLERIADAGEVDDKYSRLLDLLTVSARRRDLPKNVFTPEFGTQKVIVFTEFADTARYLHERLGKDGVADIDRLDGSRSADRVKMIRRFSPFYNKVSPADQKTLQPLRVLVSTDVLSEGVNLQDATLLVNYDLHWNPVRLMQRIGRVDRRRDPEIETALARAVPGSRAARGYIQVRNFLPPDDIEVLLRLYQRVEAKALLISKTLGIPGGKLFSPDDVLDDVKVLQAFRDEYEGELSPEEELRLRYQAMIAADPELPARLDALPAGISSAKEGAPSGVFVCQLRPTLVRPEEGSDGPGTWSTDPGVVDWSLRTTEGAILTDLCEIDAAASSSPETKHAGFSADREKTRRALRALESDRTRTYRKDVQLPLDAPPPRTVCWMEVQ